MTFGMRAWREDDCLSNPMWQPLAPALDKGESPAEMPQGLKEFASIGSNH